MPSRTRSRQQIFRQTTLRFRNDRHAATVGLDALDDAAWVRHFGRFDPLPGNLPQPLALAYHGHQFRNYNPQIGDGRGFLFAQVRDDAGRLLDLGTKGSGQTPFSRDGDGRLTLKGAVREILATEMLEALGVHTSKTFSVDRDRRGTVARRRALAHALGGAGAAEPQPYPLRHLPADRVSRMMRRRCTAWCAMRWTTLYDVRGGENDAATLLNLAVERMADLAASYMVAGFVHGVLNTDNMNITGESFDYGPWRFAPTWEPGFTAAYFDHSRAVCLCPPARGDPLEPGAAGGRAAADQRCAAADRRAGALRPAVSAGVGAALLLAAGRGAAGALRPTARWWPLPRR